MRFPIALLLVACGSKAHPAAAPQPTVAPDAAVAVASPPVAAAPPAVATAPPAVALSQDKPTQRQLAWLVDAVGKRGGAIATAELQQHWTAKSLGAAGLKMMTDWLKRWAGEAQGLRVERVEIDDPIYLVAHVAAADKRWRVVLTLEAASGLIDFVQNDKEP